MPTITNTDRALRWTVIEAGAILETGSTQLGETTIAAEINTLLSDADENALLGALVTAGVTVPSLPEPGAELRQGDIYAYSGTLLMVRKDTVRVPGDPLLQVSEFGIYREGAEAWEWIAGEVLSVGARREYKGVIYELYNDIGANNWSPPPQVAAHWRLAPTGDEWPQWIQPTGAHDAYAKGAKVTFNDKHYISLIDANAWSPAVYPAGWQVQA